MTILLTRFQGSVSVSGKGTLIPTVEESERISVAFQECQAVIFDNFLVSELLQQLCQYVHDAQFTPREISPVGLIGESSRDIAGSALSLCLSRPDFLTWVTRIFKVGHLEFAEGKVRQLSVGVGQGMCWHDDMNDRRRRLGVTINLGNRPYGGGDFEMRLKASRERLGVYHHDIPGTALLFAVGSDLEHRVTPLISGGPRRVFSGWFLSGPVS